MRRLLTDVSFNDLGALASLEFAGQGSPKVTLLILGWNCIRGPASGRSGALARNHEVTLFNRGQSNPGVLPEDEKLAGDRDGDLRMLEGRRWTLS